jgi:hypothetical protein
MAWYRSYLLALCRSSQTLFCSYLLKRCRSSQTFVLRELPTDLVSHGVDELVDVSLQEMVEAGHAPEFVVLADNFLAVLHSALSNTAVHITSFRCCGSGMFNPDPNSFHPGSRVKKIPDPDPLQRIQSIFNAKNSF